MRMTKCKNCGKVYPLSMSHCPECFTKKSLPKGAVAAIICCCIVIGICLIACIGIISNDTSSSNTDAGETVESEYIEVSADDIFAEFQENEVAANQKYKGKLVKITGVVNNINAADAFISANILLSVDSSMFGSVQCNFNSNDSKSLSNVSKGQSVTIIGTCNGLASFNVMINDCEIQ